MLIPLPWLAEFVDLGGRDGQAVAAALVSVGLEEEAVHGSGVLGPLVAGLVLDVQPEKQKNGKTINWCQVDVGPGHGGVRGIICGAHNFQPGDKVAVALPGAVLPGPFPIASRKTYGHLSDGMICSERELGLGQDHGGIIVLAGLGLDPDIGADLIPLLHLDEQTVEINVTPDRGYCFSVRGVARELSHATGSAFHDPALITAPPPSANGFQVELQDARPIRGRAGCDRFAARVVRGCSAAGPSPDWMRRRLTQAGMRPISLAVDVTNYVMLELGQPMHAYDLAGVAEPIVVRRAQAGEHLTTLDDVDRALDPEDLLITDSPRGVAASRVLGLAGVMGGASSEVSAETRDLLLEAAHFDPVTVARTSRRHKLSSEAARRFERGVDPELPPRALQRAVDLLLKYGGGETDWAVSDAGAVSRPGPISFDPAYPERMTAVAYSADQVRRILEEIGCSVADSGGRAAIPVEAGGVAGAGEWLVTPPTWRPDLTRAIDLVEEVARIAGYDTIPSVLPQAPAGPGLSRAQRLRRSVARALADFGLVEVLSYPFTGTAVFDALGYSPDDQLRQAVELANPLDSAAPLLRTEILQTLLSVLRRNISRGLTDSGLYELGLVTEPEAGARPAPMPGTDRRPSVEELEQLYGAVPPQPRHLAGLIAGMRQPAGLWGPGRPADWADAVEAALLAGRTLQLELTVEQAVRQPFHPGRCARLLAGQVEVGYAGQLDPRVAEAFGLTGQVAAFEMNLDRLIEAAPVRRSARPVSAQPLAKEDLAFVVEESVTAGDLVEAVKLGVGAICEDVSVFDVYRGGQVPSGYKSVAVALRLRADDHTLTPPEIAAARAGAVRQAAAACGAQLRA
ncbi:MAG: phenylalanine--tRNA ligase subunit beta [Bifidobacteriaceae bacterium]|jgi:phenylalanyl-tRNA synthetase beta chain|nr:phenylalanine--tRNA ligase subunit beta [Bifidobacteriaceae bacterium]